MTTGDVPVVVLLLLPGFLLIKVYGWVAYQRHVSDFEGLLWALIASFAIVCPVALIWHWADTNVPTLGEIVRDPKLLPLRVAGTTYLVAMVAGWALGQIERRYWLEWALLQLGIDLRKREDAWNVAFRKTHYAIAHLKSGECVCGWIEMATTSRRETPPELYFTDVSVWKPSDTHWTDRGDLVGIWMEASSVERLDLFLNKPSVAEKDPRQPNESH